MSKPTGAICNLDCAYCFFLAKEELYPGSDFRMSESLLGTYLSHRVVERSAHHFAARPVEPDLPLPAAGSGRT